jgi:hypothetical protein
MERGGVESQCSGRPRHAGCPALLTGDGSSRVVPRPPDVGASSHVRDCDEIIVWDSSADAALETRSADSNFCFNKIWCREKEIYGLGKLRHVATTNF